MKNEEQIYIIVTTSGTSNANESFLNEFPKAKFYGRVWRSKRTQYLITKESFEANRDLLKSLKVTKSRDKFSE